MSSSTSIGPFDHPLDCNDTSTKSAWHNSQCRHANNTICGSVSNNNNCRYTQAEPKHPEFRTRFHNTLKAVNCTVGEMTFALHKEAMVSLMSFANHLTEQLFEGQPAPPTVNANPTDRNNPMVGSITSQSVSSAQNQMQLTTKKCASQAPKKPPVVQFSAFASLAALKIILCRTGRLLAQMDVTGVEAGLDQTRRQMVSHVILKSINMTDANQMSKHPQIISITGDDVLNAKISMFEESGTEGYTDMNRVDMGIEATIGQMHFVFLWQFHLDVMSFLDSFQGAKDKVADATAAAAAAAKGAAELAYAKAYKMDINVMSKCKHLGYFRICKFV